MGGWLYKDTPSLVLVWRYKIMDLNGEGGGRRGLGIKEQKNRLPGI